ncbi:FkbM family methyltransferase [Brachyspira aalborgi]|uniref:FkbM family methyltransferase n=1 Tax=Brachyspira aalborgi TaxID=29522 RepID=A0A5C8F2L6_9SPIR|nr:FkbM family methyltransferase [Brachyspira aalborgi]TXJ44033.1 FkbM family methyltransferase [Brachyspira aalborgi]
MTEKTINNIVWWIPFRKLRDSVREVLYSIININNSLKDINKFIIKKYSNESYLYSCKLGGIDFKFYDFIFSTAVNCICNEIDDYNFDSIDFKDDDVVIDIGGNIGMVSIYLAKKYPFLKIYAFEPVKQNYENFLKNIELNNINKDIIKVFNLAITKDRRDVILTSPFNNSGASNIYNNFRGSGNIISNNDISIKSITFDDIFTNNNISKCKLLKIDCEGAEYEILYSANVENLKNCEYMRAEFHGKKYKQKDLYNHCNKFIKNIDVMYNSDDNINI